MNPIAEYDGEPVRGLPGRLPEGESILWQGSPRWTTFARRAFHTNKVLAYFGVMMVWRLTSDLYDGMEAGAAIIHTAWLAAPALLCVAILVLMAWAMARSTVYTITSKRLVMRFGVAMEKCFNIPFRRIAGAGLKSYENGTGDIPVSLIAPDRIGYLLLWPHVRPWRLSEPEPMLRSVPEAANAAGILAEALKRAALERAEQGEAAAVADGAVVAPDPAARKKERGSAPHGLGLSPQPVAAAE
ncbi:MAG: photosynthetic complex putative assembly protein PuhB [Alphaproteobacteria bacterium]